MDSQPAADLKPKRVAIFFTGIESSFDYMDEVIAHVVEDAEARGLFFEWAAVGDMEINDVVHGSPLHEALNGRFPNR